MFTANLKRQVHEHGSRILNHVVAAVRAGERQGVFKTVDAYRYAVMLWANMNGLIQFRKLEHTVLIGDNYDDLCEYAVERFIDMLAMAD
jgi:hypothetical protein